MQPRVLVVTPCYNHADVLPETIASVAAQTYPHVECVIVDDGSPDDTAEVARGLIERYPGLDLRLLRQENKGLSEARNAGVRSSDAPLVVPLDSDDKLAPEAIEKMVAAWEKEPRPSIVSPIGRCFGDSDIVMRPYNRDLTWLFRRNTYVVCSMFTREAFDAVGGYKANMAGGYEDWEFWISIIEAGGTARVVDEELFFYREDGDSMYDAALEKDLWLRSQIVLNHPQHFERGRLWLARRTRRIADPKKPGLVNRLGWLYYFVKDRNRTAFKQQLAALFGMRMPGV